MQGVLNILLVILFYLLGYLLLRDMNRLFGLYVELIRVLLIVLVLNTLLSRRAEQERKGELIAQLGSTNHNIAISAWEMLRYKGFGVREDQSLVGARLWNANLQEANMWGANLSEVDLLGANLQGANLRGTNLTWVRLLGANLQGANLSSANLSNATLRNADLSGATLDVANLSGATLRDVNLSGVDLTQANLIGAKLLTCTFDEQTLLPDAIWHRNGKVRTPESYWTSQTDMERYTNPDHPDFWQSTWSWHK